MCHFNVKSVQINEFVWISKLSDKIHYLASWLYKIMFLHIMVNRLRVLTIILHANMLFYPLYYDIISLTSLKTTQAFHLLFDFAENQIIFWDFKIRNSIRITEGSHNEDSDNPGSTVVTVLESNT